MMGHVVSHKFTDVSEVFPVSIIAVMVEAVNTSETSVNVYKAAQPNIPEESSPCQGRIKRFVGPRHISLLGPFEDSKSIGATVYSRLSGLMEG
jgi:hypothetical protein